MEYSIQLNAVNNPDKSVRAFATLVFGDSFKVTNVAVIEGSKGNFVSMPSFRTKERTSTTTRSIRTSAIRSRRSSVRNCTATS